VDTDTLKPSPSTRAPISERDFRFLHGGGNDFRRETYRSRPWALGRPPMGLAGAWTLHPPSDMCRLVQKGSGEEAFLVSTNARGKRISTGFL
jgi:hypothetical protein